MPRSIFSFGEIDRIDRLLVVLAAAGESWLPNFYHNINVVYFIIFSFLKFVSVHHYIKSYEKQHKRINYVN